MKSLLSLLVAALLLAGAAWAQERTAGQAYDAQVNWASLKNSIDLVNTQNKAIAATVTAISAKLDAIAACGARQQLWDGAGCVDAGGKQKLETKVYSSPKYDDCRGYIPPNPITKAFCQTNGYDDVIGAGEQRGTCGLGHGEHGSAVTYYGTCVRSVAE